MATSQFTEDSENRAEHESGEAGEVIDPAPEIRLSAEGADRARLIAKSCAENTESWSG